MAKFDIAQIRMDQERRPARRGGGPIIRGKEEREDRPNAVTPITLRLPRELRLCQVTIIIYTRWPFLNGPSAPSEEYMELTRGRETLAREGANADERASPKSKEQKHP